jgi:hypothetical protein
MLTETPHQRFPLNTIQLLTASTGTSFPVLIFLLKLQTMRPKFLKGCLDGYQDASAFWHGIKVRSGFSWLQPDIVT